MAGQIALEPHTMQLLEPSFAEQLQLAARNARRVLVAMGADWLSCSALLVYVSVDAISSEMTPELAWKQAYDVIAQQIENGVASKLPKLQLPSTDEQQEQLQLQQELRPPLPRGKALNKLISTSSKTNYYCTFATPQG